MWATALCNCLFSVEGIGYYKIPKNIWPSFFFDEFLWWIWFSYLCRRGICQMCYTSFKKTRKSRRFENGGCSSHLFWRNCQFLFKYLLNQIQTHSTYFVKTLLWIRQISPKGYFFALIFDNFSGVQKYFTQMLFVANSTAVSVQAGGWDGRLNKKGCFLWQ